MKSFVKRAVSVFGVVLIVGVFVAPASAQSRDPFEPLVQPALTGSDGSAPVLGGTATNPPVVPSGSSGRDGVPDTGFDASAWAAAGYSLIALGLAAYAYSRLAPPRVSRRTRWLIHPFGP